MIQNEKEGQRMSKTEEVLHVNVVNLIFLSPLLLIIKKPNMIKTYLGSSAEEADQGKLYYLNLLYKPLILPNTNENPEQRFKHFYDKDQRRKAESDPEYKMTDFVETLFTDIFVNFREKCYTQTFQKFTDHPLLQIILDPSKIKHYENNEGDTGIKKGTCDEIMYEYLKECSVKANKEYFRFTHKFILLFRECINKFKQDEAKTENGLLMTFTETNPAEQAPDLCNEFITEFMENADFFGLNLDRERLELIEVIQHFCHWLFDKNYTTSRLTLLSG
jgi:hypothetical protein